MTLKIGKKLRTACLNSKFTGSCKSKVYWKQSCHAIFHFHSNVIVCFHMATAYNVRGHNPIILRDCYRQLRSERVKASSLRPP